MKIRMFRILSGVLFCVALDSSSWAASPVSNLNVTSWAYQLQEIDVDQVVAADAFQLIVIDYSADGGMEGKFTPEQIGRIRQSGKKAIAYLSIGEAESYRSYWNIDWESNPPSWLGPENQNWLSNYKVRFWDPAWQNVIFAYLDEIYDQGFDGIYCDIIDAYYYWQEENPEKPDADALMAQFIIDLREHLSDRKDREFAIIIQNGETIIDEENVTDILRGQLFDAIDGIGVEDVFFSGDQDDNNPYHPELERLPYLREFLENGKTVLSVEYLTDPSLIQTYLIEAEKEGFVPYVARRSLSQLSSKPLKVSLSARLGIVSEAGQLTIEIIGGSGGEVWNVERSSNLVDWELVGKVVLEMNDGFASGVLAGVALDGGSSFFRATR
jgi:cysteinyl-tRNA synthetase